MFLFQLYGLQKGRNLTHATRPAQNIEQNHRRHLHQEPTREPTPPAHPRSQLHKNHKLKEHPRTTPASPIRNIAYSRAISNSLAEEKQEGSPSNGSTKRLQIIINR